MIVTDLKSRHNLIQKLLIFHLFLLLIFLLLILRSDLQLSTHILHQFTTLPSHLIRFPHPLIHKPKLSLVLSLVKVHHPQLCPHKINLTTITIVSHHPPKSTLHQLLNQRTIVSTSNIHLILPIRFELVLPVHLTIQPIRPLQFE